MKRIALFLFFVGMLHSRSIHAKGLWEPLAGATNTNNARLQNVNNYLLYTLDEPMMKVQVLSFQSSPLPTQTIELPMPDGNLKIFRVWENTLIPAVLAAKYPGLKTYTAEAVGEPAITAKIDFTTYGFHAMIFDGINTSLIDPVDITANSTYIVRYKSEERRLPDESMQCLVPGHEQLMITGGTSAKNVAKTISGYQLRTYRLALACNHQYAQKVTGLAAPTKAQVLSKMVTTMNRVNGVYEREFSVTMVLVAKEDTLIFTDTVGDPYGTNNYSPGALLDTNQKYCDSFIGIANYDVGHIFSTGGGGVSSVANVCTNGSKARSVTGNKSPMGDGFDIDYVAHEMGHEFGSEHTFNNNIFGSCGSNGGNATQEFAYEPGSGSTIMAYAGICSPDDLQPHSDAYFCASSLQQIYTYITTGGNSCAVKAPTGNKPVSLSNFSLYYTIPYQTPFELQAPLATDSIGSSSVTYCWEQADLGDFGLPLRNTSAHGPLFRSFYPDTARLRVFPKMNKVLGGILDDSGNENAEGEKIPDVARTLNFKLTVRNIYNGHGCFLFPDDSIHLNVINTGTGFAVTSQGKEGLLYLGSSDQKVEWEVAQTNLGPINTSHVDIYLTTDSGRTWPYYLGNFPNSGSAIVTLPNPVKSVERARIKVKGTTNVFFNVNKNDFELINNPDSTGEIKVFPIPTHNSLNIVTGKKGTVQAVIFDVAGRTMWQGEINGIESIDVTYWPRAMYILKLIDVRGNRTIRKFVVE